MPVRRVLQVKIWFQNRRARERRGKDVAASVMSAAQPLTAAAAAAGGGGGVASSQDLHHRHHQHQVTGMMYAGDTDAADTCAVSPYSVDEGAGSRAVLTPPEHVLNVCLYCDLNARHVQCITRNV